MTVAYQGDTQKVLLELSPLQWDEAKGELTFARTLRVGLRFKSVARRRDRRRVSGRQVAAQLVTTAKELHRVSFDEVFRRRQRALDARRLRLSRQGETVAFHVEPNRDRFGPGSVLYFVSDGEDANPYGKEAVYELEVGVRGERMPVEQVPPSGPPTNFYWQRLEQEQDRLYLSALVDAEDIWLWEPVMAGETKRYPFSITALAEAVEPARLVVRLQGGSDLPPNPDHHVRALVNGVVVGEATWNAKRADVLEGDIPPGALREGDNLLELVNVGDTEAAYSMVYLDGFTLEFLRRLEAEEGRLSGRWSQSGFAEVSGLGDAAVVIDTTEETPRWLSGTSLDGGTARISVESGRNYLFESRPFDVEVRQPIRSALRAKTRQSDYLVIGPREFIAAAAPLLEHRQAQGLSVSYVAVEEIFSEFGYGERAPESIRAFLAYAYTHWRKPAPRYVLLLGDGTYDYEDVFKLGRVHDRVPPMMLKTRFLWTASDPALASVNGDDLLP